MAELFIKERHDRDVTILDLTGRITLGESSISLRNEIRRLLSEGQKNILLNLTDVTYIDSSGLGNLVASFSTTRKEEGRLKLLHLTDKVRELMAITKLLTVFESFEDERAALDSYTTG